MNPSGPLRSLGSLRSDSTYVEFDGSHTIPPAIASTAMQFILTA